MLRISLVYCTWNSRFRGWVEVCRAKYYILFEVYLGNLSPRAFRQIIKTLNSTYLSSIITLDPSSFLYYFKQFIPGPIKS